MSKVTDIKSYWRNGLILGREKTPKRCLANVMHVFSLHPDWRDVLAYDEFGQCVITQKQPPMRAQDAPAKYQVGDWTDEDSTRTAAWFASEVGFEPSTTHVDQGVGATAKKRVVHPVRDWLTSLEWDGTPRVDSFATIYLGANDSPYAKAVGRRWMIAAVARVFEPGCKVDSLLALEGKQGIGKSSALKMLAGAELFADTGITIGDKDSYQSLRRKWVYEFGELGGIKGREIERVKNFLSSQVDTYRASYARRTQDHPRQVVFAGSTNDEQYLADPTGSRRFWPLRCGRIDLDRITADRDQLWAEAVHLYRAGEPWHLDTAELRELAANETADREQHDDWDTLVGRWLQAPTVPDGREARSIVRLEDGITTADVLLGALDFASDRISHSATIRVGHVLRRLGFGPARQVWIPERRTSERRYFRDCEDTVMEDTP